MTVFKKTKIPSVGVVCSTYRNPDHDSLVRLYGVVSLFDQMMNQDYEGDIKIALVDDSPEPHPFYKEISKAYDDRLVYIHVPDRNKSHQSLKDGFPKASSFMPCDDTLAKAVKLDIALRMADGQKIQKAELKLARGDFNLSKMEWDQIIGRSSGEFVPYTDDTSADDFAGDAEVLFWRERYREVGAYARFLPFEDDYPIQTNILSQIFLSRPTIGMKKNIGVQALEEKFGKYDAIVYCDDDDHHAPDYIARSISGLGDNSFTRMTRYLTLLFNKESLEKGWGVFDLRIQKDANGYWILPEEEKLRSMKMRHPEGYVYEKSIGSKFSRPVSIAWPVLSHEGALHTYSFNAWENSVSAFGGAVPVSFCEDILYYRMLKDHFGRKFCDVRTDVSPGQESFIRIADGRNASVIEWMDDISPSAIPEWGRKALSLLFAAIQRDDTDRVQALRKLGQNYAKTGKIDLSLIQDANPVRPGPEFTPV